MKSLLPVLLIALLWAVDLQAQPRPDSPRRPFERIERWKKVRMIEFLDLSEEQSSRFFARLHEHEKRRRALNAQHTEGLDRLERLVRNRAAGPDYLPAFQEVMEVQANIGALDREFFESLDDLLSVEQRAKFLLFERQFERQLRDAFREMRRGRTEGGPGPEGEFPDF